MSGRRLVEGYSWPLFGPPPVPTEPREFRESLTDEKAPKEPAERLKDTIIGILGGDRRRSVQLDEVRSALKKAAAPRDRDSSEAERFESLVSLLREILDGAGGEGEKVEALKSAVGYTAEKRDSIERSFSESLRGYPARAGRRLAESIRTPEPSAGRLASFARSIRG